MKTAEEILIETLNLKTQITEKDYWMTVKVGDCLKAINKALAISRVVGRSEQLPCEHDYQPDTTCGVDITCCTKCGDII